MPISQIQPGIFNSARRNSQTSGGVSSIDPSTLSGLLVLYDIDNAAAGPGAGGPGACNLWSDSSGNARDATGNPAHAFYQPTLYNDGPNGHKRVYFDYGVTLSWVGNPTGDGFRDSMKFLPAITTARTAFCVLRHFNGFLQGTGYGAWTGNDSGFPCCGMPGVRFVDSSFGKSDQILTGEVRINNKIVPPKYAWVPQQYALAMYEFISDTSLNNLGWSTNGFDTQWEGDIVAYGVFNRTLTSGEKQGIYNFYQNRFSITPNSSRPLYVCLGDSITQGPATNGQYDYMSSLVTRKSKAMDFINCGKFGETSGGGATRIITDGADCADSSRSRLGLIVMYGVNDCVAGTPTNTITTNLTSIATTARSQGYNRLILCTITKDGQGGRPPDFDANRAALNTAILANFGSYGYDAAADVGGAPNLQDPSNATYYLGDSIHLTTDGQAEVAGVLNSYVTA